MIRKDIYRYEAEEGNFIIRNFDNVIVGESICVSKTDPITNYHEEPYTEESYREFYKSIGVVFEDENEQEPQEENDEGLDNEGNEEEQEPEEVTDEVSEEQTDPEENN